ncbi:MAG: trypsin-like peptidase domain-containing protein [Gemmatimonadaceae bacterium]|nr:trypsin-like peptidase domain-containing protein [Gemmatimonadaceae bacterium]
MPQTQPGAGTSVQPASDEETGAPVPSVQVYDAVAVVEHVKPAVVTVVNRRAIGDLRQQRTLEAGRGTGFIIDEAGHVVTNEHVVRGGDEFDVLLSDGTVRPATLVGADPLSDLAVVRIDGDVPATVAFGNSDDLRQGQPVLAIGSPLGEFTGTVTDGIVSALNRDFPGAAAQGESAYSNLIQHNAAINPGNSGGPLFDLAGRVVGVNTLGIPQTQTGVPAQGLFFAIPSNTVSGIAQQMIENGHVAYPYLGVSYVEISPELAAVNDLPVDYGAYVQEVIPGGPADRGGLRPGDIVTSVGGHRIDASSAFTEALFANRPGETVEVGYLRGDAERTTQVTLEERPDQDL